MYTKSINVKTRILPFNIAFYIWYDFVRYGSYYYPYNILFRTKYNIYQL